MPDGDDGPQPVDLSYIRSAMQSDGHNLEFHEGSVKDAVQACTDLMHILEQIQNRLPDLQTVHGMDSIDSGRELAKGLGERANMDPGHFGQAVQEHLKTVTAIRDAIEASGKNYFEREHINIEDLHKPSKDGQMPPMMNPSQGTPNAQTAMNDLGWKSQH